MAPAPAAPPWRREKAWASVIPASGSRHCTALAPASSLREPRKAAPQRRCGCPITSWSERMVDIRALIVDDEPLARRGIRQLLAPYPDIAVVGECRDGREAVRALATVKPDLVFLDVQMPGLDGMSVIRIHGAQRMPVTVFV